MVASGRPRYTVDEYLLVEEESAVRHEYLDGEIFAMAGGTPEHAALAAAVLGSLVVQLRGGRCRPYSSDLRVKVPASGLLTYPDGAVICGEPERDPESPTHVLNPTVLIEVLSPSTQDYDRGDKRRHYQQLPSLQAYVLVAQDRRRVEVWARAGDTWTERTYASGDVVVLAAIACNLDVDALYTDAGLTALR